MEIDGRTRVCSATPLFSAPSGGDSSFQDAAPKTAGRVKHGFLTVFSTPSFWVAAAVFAVFETLSIVGSLLYARSTRAANVSEGTDLAISASTRMAQILDSNKAPVSSAAVYITMVRGM